MNERLITLGKTLKDLHKELLSFQIRIVEQIEERKFTPYDMLNLSLNDSRFEWLRKLSELIIQIDIKTDESEESDRIETAALISETHRLLGGHYMDFSNSYEAARTKDPHLTMYEVAVKKALTDTEITFKERSSDLHLSHTENEKAKFRGGLDTTKP